MIDLLPLATIPFKDIPPLEVMGLKFYPFGFLVGVAIIYGSHVMTKRANLLGLDERVCAELALWAVIPGMIGAHLYSAIFYFPERVLEDPIYLIQIWDGISSFGGFLGGAAGVVYYLKRNKIPVWSYGDCVVYGLTFAFIFGRLGCTFAYDHPGLPTDFFLGMEFPRTLEVGGSVEAPTARHNLGFYEAMWISCICVVLHFAGKKPRFSGWVVATVLLIYTPARFFFDTLRVVDVTYLGLTPGQYAALGLFITGLWIHWMRSRIGEVMTPDGQVHVFV
ncbi:MAG: prolipoprotein diacylglyceryl transferase family protein, partial [Myxococcota bacterium]|nr:prolipoprotein diacylglyceryl transferase family protein [Myxococcota bacterium]